MKNITKQITSIKNYSDVTLERYNVNGVSFMVGTTSAKDKKDAEEFFQKLANNTSSPEEILSIVNNLSNLTDNDVDLDNPNLQEVQYDNDGHTILIDYDKCEAYDLSGNCLAEAYELKGIDRQIITTNLIKQVKNRYQEEQD